jgi:CheY-like chemotaxis protein
MAIFPDLTHYRIVLVDHRAETTAMIAAIFSVAGVELTVAAGADAAARLIRSSRPSLVLVATAVAGEPFAVVETAHRDGVPVLALDLGSAGPEVSDILRRKYGVAVLRNFDEPEALCVAAKRAADEAADRPTRSRKGAAAAPFHAHGQGCGSP